MSAQVELKVGQRWVYRGGESRRGCDDVITKITEHTVSAVDDLGHGTTWTLAEFRSWHPSLRKPTPEPVKVGDFVTVTASQSTLDAYCAKAVPGSTYRVDQVDTWDETDTYPQIRCAGVAQGWLKSGDFRRATDVEIAGMLRPDAPAPVTCTAVTYHGDVNGVLRLDGRPDHVGAEVRMANETEPVIVEVPFADAPRIGDKVTITFARG